MGSMKRLAFLFSCSAALACAADLSSVHNVYLLKMTKGLDQYLANRLTGDHVFQVVTDPKLADAVFTDQIGEGFQMKLEELFPTPESDKPTLKPKPKSEDEETSPLLTDTVNKLQNPASNSSFGRARGTVFLVDAKTRQVVWSIFEPAKDASSQSLDRTAKDIVSRVKQDLKKK
ncbi:MAG: hypothetical protein JWP63_4728 [Candidatus Solibacter sp.]|jgi:hypothetical protein|nr:hypothetical protein [Candidatus Solibacter sp.]